MTPLNNLYKVLSELEEIDINKCRGVMSNYDSYVDGVQNRIYIQTFIAQYRNAEKYYLKGNKAGEKKSLLFAMNVSESIKSIDEYFRNDDIRDYITGKILTSEILEQRLEELGTVRWS